MAKTTNASARPLAQIDRQLKRKGFAAAGNGALAWSLFRLTPTLIGPPNFVLPLRQFRKAVFGRKLHRIGALRGQVGLLVQSLKAFKGELKPGFGRSFFRLKLGAATAFPALALLPGVGQSRFQFLMVGDGVGQQFRSGVE
jgi:hypothetical protein